MTTDRTALEAARDALQTLVDVIDAAGLLNLSRGVELGPTVWYVKASDAMDSARAALSSPPVLPPVAWCELTLDGKSIAHFDGKPMVMVGPVGNECHPHALYLAAPQASAPALDDARDAARWRFVRSPQISTSEHHALIEAIRSDEGEHLDAAIDALMQQEPRS